MPREAILLIRDDPFIKSCVDKLTAQAQAVSDKMKFIEKQVNDMKDDSHAKAGAIWSAIESHLLAKDLLPQGYKRERDSLYMDVETGVLLLIKPDPPKEENPASELIQWIAKFFGGGKVQ